jgi:hypothetical protein
MAQALLDKWGNLVVPSTLCALAAERDRYKARAEQAEGALDKLASMACIGSGIALGRDLLRDANEGDIWADEMAARVKFARAALAQTDAEPIEPGSTLADAYRAGRDAAAEKAEKKLGQKRLYDAQQSILDAISALEVPNDFGGK